MPRRRLAVKARLETGVVRSEIRGPRNMLFEHGIGCSGEQQRPPQQQVSLKGIGQVDRLCRFVVHMQTGFAQCVSGRF